MAFAFNPPLIQGYLIKRYKRFLVDIQLLDGQIITAHCANSGSMLGVQEPGSIVWIQPTSGSGALQYRWQLIEVDNTLVCINTMNPNKLVEDALLREAIPELGSYLSYRREVKYGHNSRIDFQLDYEGGAKAFVEVKSVHLKQNEHACFPDSVTARGTKHLKELQEVVSMGHKAVVLFVVQRSDCEVLSPAAHIDPEFAHELSKAHQKGVGIYAYSCHISTQKLEFFKKMRILGL